MKLDFSNNKKYKEMYNHILTNKNTVQVTSYELIWVTKQGLGLGQQ